MICRRCTRILLKTRREIENMYRENTMNCFTNQINLGEIEDADGIATVVKCGDIMRMHLNIDEGY